MKLEVPFFRQQEANTCGPACLRMVLGYYGVQASEHEVARDCGTTIIGTDRRGLVVAAIHRGLAARSEDRVTCDDLEDYVKRRAPVIAVVDPDKLYGRLPNFPHSVVLVGIDADTVAYHDPARGPNLAVSRSHFAQAWDALRRKAVIAWKPQ
jgi:ATP-binding cassette subfamily B protein